MTPWHAHVPTIRGKGRARFAQGRAYTPTETRAYESEIATLCRLARGRDPIGSGWVVVGVIILDAIPSEWRLKDGGPTLQARRAAWQAEPAAARPDADNVIKAGLDGANKVWFTGDAKVLPIPWRGWTADPKRAGLHLYCWPAPTPADAFRVAFGGTVADVIRRLVAPPAGWEAPEGTAGLALPGFGGVSGLRKAATQGRA